MANSSRRKARQRRHNRIRRKVFGSAERPRMAVFRSNRHMAVQLIDDNKGHTLCSASTLESDLRDSTTSNADAATKVGGLIAERAKAAGVSAVVFDRGGNRFHGRVAALAKAAREGGLEF